VGYSGERRFLLLLDSSSGGDLGDSQLCISTGLPGESDQETVSCNVAGSEILATKG